MIAPWGPANGGVMDLLETRDASWETRARFFLELKQPLQGPLTKEALSLGQKGNLIAGTMGLGAAGLTYLKARRKGGPSRYERDRDEAKKGGKKYVAQSLGDKLTQLISDNPGLAAALSGLAMGGVAKATYSRAMAGPIAKASPGVKISSLQSFEQLLIEDASMGMAQEEEILEQEKLAAVLDTMSDEDLEALEELIDAGLIKEAFVGKLLNWGAKKLMGRVGGIGSQWGAKRLASQGVSGAAEVSAKGLVGLRGVESALATRGAPLQQEIRRLRGLNSPQALEQAKKLEARHLKLVQEQEKAYAHSKMLQDTAEAHSSVAQQTTRQLQEQIGLGGRQAKGALQQHQAFHQPKPSRQAPAAQGVPQGKPQTRASSSVAASPSTPATGQPGFFQKHWKPLVAGGAGLAIGSQFLPQREVTAAFQGNPWVDKEAGAFTEGLKMFWKGFKPMATKSFKRPLSTPGKAINRMVGPGEGATGSVLKRDQAWQAFKEKNPWRARGQQLGSFAGPAAYGAGGLYVGGKLLGGRNQGGQGQ